MLWRRVVAFALDSLFAWLVAIAVLMTIGLVSAGNVVVGGSLLPFDLRCQTARADTNGILNGSRLNSGSNLILCESTAFFVQSSYVVPITLETPGEPILVQLRIPVTTGDHSIDTTAPTELLTLVILILGSAVWLRLALPSPGKRLMGLYVEGTGCAVCRELRRIWPFIPITLVWTAADMLPLELKIRTALNFPWMSLFMGLTALLAIFAYYGLATIRTGKSGPWNTKTGFAVTRWHAT